jgi:oxygen-dependent protoporphyrinogen oxidase
MSPWLYRLGAAALLSAAMFGCDVPVEVVDEAPVAEPSATEQVEVAGQNQQLTLDPRKWPSKSESRIAIVGAGPSGLTAADTLQELGYQKITVFEKNDRVGGKVYSKNLTAGIPGAPENIAELGAVFASADYTLVLDLANKHGVKTEAYGGAQTILDESGVRHTGESFLTSRYPEPTRLIAATAAYGVRQAENFMSNANGFALGPNALDQTFDQFIAEPVPLLGNIEPITEAARSVLVGFGYGYYETVPAAYFWKLLPWLMKIGGPKGLTPAQYLTFPEGFQSLWTKVAADLDVRLNSEVTSITRRRIPGRFLQPSRDVVDISVNGGPSQEFDYVIISAPLNKVPSFVQFDQKDPEDRATVELFSKVKSLRYFVSVFFAGGLVNGEALFFHKNAFPDAINHVNVWANREPTAPFVAYQIAERGLSTDEVKDVLKADVASQNGVVVPVAPGRDLLVQQEWDNYFPHVTEADMKDDFYGKVEALQGKKGTYYVGGTLSFETVEHSARYAKELVLKNFLLSR